MIISNDKTRFRYEELKKLNYGAHVKGFTYMYY